MKTNGEWRTGTITDVYGFWIPVEGRENTSKVFAEVYTMHFGGEESYEIKFYDSRVPRSYMKFIKSAKHAKAIVEEQYKIILDKGDKEMKSIEVWVYNEVSCKYRLIVCDSPDAKEYKSFAEVSRVDGPTPTYETKFSDDAAEALEYQYKISASLEEAKHFVEDTYHELCGRISTVVAPKSYLDNSELKQALEAAIYTAGIDGDFGLTNDAITEYLLAQLNVLRDVMRGKENK